MNLKGLTVIVRKRLQSPVFRSIEERLSHIFGRPLIPSLTPFQVGLVLSLRNNDQTIKAMLRAMWSGANKIIPLKGMHFTNVHIRFLVP